MIFYPSSEWSLLLVLSPVNIVGSVYFTHMKRNLCSLCSQREWNTWHLDFKYRYIDGVLSISSPGIENDLDQMYPVELEFKETTASNTSSSYLYLLISTGRDGQLTTSINDTRDNFNFHTTNFRSWVAIWNSIFARLWRFYLAAYTICSSCKCLFLGKRDLSISFINRDTPRNAWNRHLRSSMVDTGILSNNMKFPSHGW